MNSKWDLLARPPKECLKQIVGGRLKGMTDVNPQWRYKAMHDTYGPCGEGWKYEITKIWTEQGTDGQVFMFAQISVQVKEGGGWSEPIPGIGGSMLIEKDKYGLHHNDEAVKMAVTDALSVSLKMLGVAADIYMGRYDGSKYKDTSEGTGVKNTIKSQSSDVDIAKAKEWADELLACLPDEKLFYTKYQDSKRDDEMTTEIQALMWGMLYGDNSPIPSAYALKQMLSRVEKELSKPQTKE